MSDKLSRTEILKELYSLKEYVESIDNSERIVSKINDIIEGI